MNQAIADPATEVPRVAPAAPLLSVEDLHVHFVTSRGVVRAVEGVSWQVYPGEMVALVGESGCGKSVSALSVMRLLAKPAGRIVHGRILFEGRNLLELDDESMRQVRGRDISMIFQEPMTSLNPVLSIGLQIMEPLIIHKAMGEAQARTRALELLALVGVSDPERRLAQYPHQFSGGMRQRVMIAIGLACNPKLIIADEPTTALDVTSQAQVLDVLRVARRETGAAAMLITHDLGVVAELADRVVVMYAGRVVEVADVGALFHGPRHPYTLGLMACRPRLDGDDDTLEAIPGRPPSLIRVPSGCSYHPRCQLGHDRERCAIEAPVLSPTGRPGQRSACHFHDELAVGAERVSAAIGVELSR